MLLFSVISRGIALCSLCSRHNLWVACASYHRAFAHAVLAAWMPFSFPSHLRHSYSSFRFQHKLLFFREAYPDSPRLGQIPIISSVGLSLVTLTPSLLSLLDKQLSSLVEHPESRDHACSCSVVAPRPSPGPGVGQVLNKSTSGGK